MPAAGIAQHENYKRTFNNTMDECTAAGYNFIPAVWDGDGGAGREANRLLKQASGEGTGRTPAAASRAA